jgi:dethiobiotin synthase
MSLPQRLFVTGTDTGVGKTIVSAALTLGMGAKYWKPIQSGILEGTDTETVRSLTNLSAEHFYPERYLLTEPLSPHAAAEIDGVNINLSELTLPGSSAEPLIVEGAGGVMVPINESEFMLDVMHHLRLPVLIVARSGLGTINHTLLTLQCLRASGLEVVGVIMNGPLNRSNRKAITEFGKVEVLAEIPPIEALSRETLLDVFRAQFSSQQVR